MALDSPDEALLPEATELFPQELDAFTQAVGLTNACLDEVRGRLQAAREAKEALRLEIKRLVWEERQLTRMVRIGGEAPRDDEPDE
jgi:hypothetical protein